MNCSSQTADFEFPQAGSTCNSSVIARFYREIQVADVLAGFIARYVQDDAVGGRRPMHPDKVAIFRRLRRNRRPQLAWVSNFVAPDNMIRFLGIEPRRISGRHCRHGRIRRTGAGSSPVLAGPYRWRLMVSLPS